jgi:predicted DNA binding CopG/RHH family protein
MTADGKPGRPKSPPEKFYRRVTIRMTEEQLAEIKRRAAQAGVSYNQYIRDCALKAQN